MARYLCALTCVDLPMPSRVVNEQRRAVFGRQSQQERQLQQQQRQRRIEWKTHRKDTQLPSSNFVSQLHPPWVRTTPTCVVTIGTARAGQSVSAWSPRAAKLDRHRPRDVEKSSLLIA
jgi:hypothetical protein